MSILRRNEPCPCGSGKRFKHCCGGPHRVVGTDADGELLALILAADEEGLAAGEGPRQRSFKTVIRVVDKLFPAGCVIAGVGAPPEVERTNELIRSLYRPEDIGVGGVHLGAFMFRDVFTRVSVPIGFGTFRLNPLDQIDLSAGQKAWLQRREPDYLALCDQFADLFDFGYGLMDLGHDRKVGGDSSTLMGLAHFQLQAAAATITGAYDLRGAVQSALLRAELALKGGLAANGISMDDLKDNFGHNHLKMSKALASFESAFDAPRVDRVIKKFPKFAPNRYDPNQPNRVDAGHIVMGSQYLASEVMRQLSRRDIRSTGMSIPRTYPA